MEALGGGLDAVETIGDPLGALDRSRGEVALKLGGDLLGPIFRSAKEEDRSRESAHFAAHLFEAELKIGADAAHEEDGEVEVELGLPLDEAVEAVGHFGIDVGVLPLLIDDGAFFAAEIGDVGAGEDFERLGNSVADFHHAGAAAGDKGDRGVFVQKRVLHVGAHFEDALEEGGELLFEIAGDEVGAVDAEGGGVEEGFNIGEWDEHARVLLGLGDVLEDFFCGFVDPENGDRKLGEIEEEGAVFVGEKFAVGERGVLEIDPFKAAEDLIAEEHSLHHGGGEIAGEEDSFAGDELVLDGF